MIRLTSVLALALCACRPATSPAAANAEGVVVTSDVAYGEHARQALDVYAPEEARLAPVVLFVHGGYWMSGGRHAPEHGEGLYESVGRSLARRGLVAVIPSYRLAPEVKVAGMLDDVTRALAWTSRSIDRLGGDSLRIHLMGHSAGGHLAALIALEETWTARHRLPADVVKGTIALSAVWDLPAMRAAQPDRFNRDVTYRVFGRDDAVLKRFSPIAHVEERRKPFLLVVGERDVDFLVRQANAALDALHDANTDATLRIVRRYDHLDLVRRFGQPGDPVIEHVVGFIEGP